jgi:hypothetical protein
MLPAPSGALPGAADGVAAAGPVVRSAEMIFSLRALAG